MPLHCSCVDMQTHVFDFLPQLWPIETVYGRLDTKVKSQRQVSKTD